MSPVGAPLLGFITLETLDWLYILVLGLSLLYIVCIKSRFMLESSLLLHRVLYTSGPSHFSHGIRAYVWEHHCGEQLKEQLYESFHRGNFSLCCVFRGWSAFFRFVQVWHLLLPNYRFLLEASAIALLSIAKKPQKEDIEEANKRGRSHISSKSSKKVGRVSPSSPIMELLEHLKKS